MVAEHIFFMLLIVSRRIHLKQVRIVQSTCKLFEFTQQIDRGNESEMLELNYLQKLAASLNCLRLLKKLT